MTGLALIAIGIGLLWSSKAYAQDILDVQKFGRRRAAEAGWPRWLLAVAYPPFNRSVRFTHGVGVVLGVAVILAGALNLAGVWS